MGYLRARAKTLSRKAETFCVHVKLRLSHRTGQDLLANLQNVKQVNYLSAKRYVPRPCKGSVTLFRCTSRSLGDHPDYLMGWRHLARAGVHVEETPGDHVTMLMEPHVRVLAEKLCACLRNASSGSQAHDLANSSGSEAAPRLHELIRFQAKATVSEQND